MNVRQAKSYSKNVKRLRSVPVLPKALSARCLLLTLALVLMSVGVARAQTSPATQKLYSSPEEAKSDLVAAAKRKDREELRRIFGPDIQSLISVDPVQETTELEDFNDASAEKVVLVKETDSRYTLNIGNEGWPFPIPIARTNDKWFFDTRAGGEELLTRRIGENEIDTIMVCKAYAVAQWDYFLDGDWDSDQVPEFAPKFLSSQGQKDGLYWPTSAQEDPSPLGPLAASARQEGYSAARDNAGRVQPTPFHGYYLKVLTAQGMSAPGGRHSYIVNGNMIGGFALVAYPAKYGSTCVMTFIVSQQGRVYQKNLGPKTEAAAKAITEYNPDPSWKPAAEEIAIIP
jgi:hypothetical protein